MPVICWGNLAKAADDDSKIEQSIQEYVMGHDENPNAHMGEQYALGAHRLQNILDHPYSSIYPWHVYAIDAFSIATGALVVKGQGPYIVVQAPDESERVKIYPEGIIIKKGKIVLETEDDKNIIDAKGIRGSNIIYSGEAHKEDDQRFTGDAEWALVTPLQFGFYLARPSPVLVFGNIKWRMYDNEANPLFKIEYPGGYFPSWKWLSGWGPLANTHNYGEISFTHLLMLAGGYNLLRLLGCRSTPDAEVYVLGENFTTTFGYMVLGN